MISSRRARWRSGSTVRATRHALSWSGCSSIARMGDTERWHLVHDGHEHGVTVERGALVREAVWTRDGVEVGRKKTSDETFVVAPKGADGAVRLKFGVTGPARRVTLHDSETEAHTGLGGIDLEPEAGSKAAERAEWIGAHPHLHTARQTAIAAAGVGVPVLAIWLLTLVPWPAIPWPDVDLPDLPPWVDTVRKLAIPILIAFFIARGEVKRRRKVEEKKAEEKKAL